MDSTTTTNLPPSRRVSAAAAVEKMSPYIVKGADIWSARGRHKEGSTVELTPAEARHFTKKGLLAPFIPGEEHEV